MRYFLTYLKGLAAAYFCSLAVDGIDAILNERFWGGIRFTLSLIFGTWSGQLAFLVMFSTKVAIT